MYLTFGQQTGTSVGPGASWLCPVGASLPEQELLSISQPSPSWKFPFPTTVHTGSAVPSCMGVSFHYLWWLEDDVSLLQTRGKNLKTWAPAAVGSSGNRTVMVMYPGGRNIITWVRVRLAPSYLICCGSGVRVFFSYRHWCRNLSTLIEIADTVYIVLIFPEERHLFHFGC